MKLQRSLVVVVVALFAAACGGIGGSGTSKTQTREVAAFHRVEVSGALEVNLTDRDPGSVVVTSDDNLLEHIVTTVEDGVLKVKPKDDTRLFIVSPTSIEVSWKSLNEAGASGASLIRSSAGIVCERVALAVSGASRIELDTVVGNEVVIWASGASHVSLRDVQAPKGEFQLSGASKVDIKGGTLTSYSADISGASHLELGTMAAETAALNVSGASHAKVTATKAVTGTVSGASFVSVRGNPPERALGASGGSDVKFE
jgi:hypothetical protein